MGAYDQLSSLSSVLEGCESTMNVQHDLIKHLSAQLEVQKLTSFKLTSVLTHVINTNPAIEEELIPATKVRSITANRPQ